jgi:hypothetical protein
MTILLNRGVWHVCVCTCACACVCVCVCMKGYVCVCVRGGSENCVYETEIKRKCPSMSHLLILFYYFLCDMLGGFLNTSWTNFFSFVRKQSHHRWVAALSSLPWAKVNVCVCVCVCVSRPLALKTKAVTSQFLLLCVGGPLLGFMLGGFLSTSWTNFFPFVRKQSHHKGGATLSSLSWTEVNVCVCVCVCVTTSCT